MKKTQPFIKWVGGKRQVLNDLISSMPKTYKRFYEPFIGGGALFFHIMPKNGYISDINPDLINLYEVVRDNVHELVEDLRKHENEEEYYYSIRNIDRTSEYNRWDNIQKASRLIYLNKKKYLINNNIFAYLLKCVNS